MPRRRRALALTYETSDVEDALACAQMVAEAMATGHLATEEDGRRAPRAIAAVLRLVTGRIRLLRKAMLGDLDPAVLWHPGNDALPERTEGRGPCLTERTPREGADGRDALDD